MKMDVARQIGADVREVGSREHEGRPARVVVATRTYDTTREDFIRRSSEDWCRPSIAAGTDDTAASAAAARTTAFYSGAHKD